MSDQVETASPTRVQFLPSLQPGALTRKGNARRNELAGLLPAGKDETKRSTFRFFGPFGLVLGFLLMVAIPTGVAGFYFFRMASDVFVSEAKFAVRGSTEKLPSSSSNATMMMSSIASLNSNQDAYIVASFIQSIPMIERLEREEKLRSLFTRDTVDVISRLPPSASMERLRAYWSRMVSASVDSLSGVVTLEVRAYAPADALALSRAIITASEELVNELSRRKRQDALRFAYEEVARAEERIKASVAAMQAFRNETGFLDPVKSAEAVSKLLASLRSDQIELSNELATARSSLSENSPSVQILSARLAALTAQTRNIARELTTQNGDGDKSASRALAVYEGLMLEREFSEKFYTTMLGIAEKARAESDAQQLYLVTFVEPGLAETASYPRRGGDVAVVFVCCLALWSIVSLLVAAVRDHDT